MTKNKTSLGIEISAGQVSFALLSRGKGRVKVVKADCARLPEGAFEDGNIVEPKAVGRVIRRLLSKNGVRAMQAFVSLTANPTLMQIIDLPLEIPANLREFVQSEIRHSAALSGKGHQLDYCGLGANSPGNVKRVMVAAVDNAKLAPLLKALDYAKVEPLSIEPTMIGWVRALHANHVANNYDGNVMFVKGDRSKMTTCVFRKGMLDFIRSRNFASTINEQDYTDAFCQEVNSVKQYYDVEVASFEDVKWDLAVDIGSEFDGHDEINDFLCCEFGSVHFCSSGDLAANADLDVDDLVVNLSMAAVGIALGGLGASRLKAKFDLVPSQVREKKAAGKFAFAAISIAAVFMVIVTLSNDLLGAKYSATDNMVSDVKKQLDLETIGELIAGQQLIEDKMAGLESDRQFMAEAFSQEVDRDWSGILNAVVEKSPVDLCITQLRQVGDDAMVISGKVTSYRSVHDFAKLVEKTGYFKSVVVSQIDKDSYYDGLIKYTVDCIIHDNESVAFNAK